MCFFIPIILFLLLALAWWRGSIGDITFIRLSAIILIPDLIMIILYIFTEVI